jgi:cysteinyl-tRNA synthetase
MDSRLEIYNTITRKKEPFRSIHPDHVGMYVCGPTVYGEAHLGHARPAVTFDLVYRYLTHLGYKVRYVRNITDVGHLEDETAGEGEDKIQKKARLEKLEPMEVAQYFTDRYHQDMERLNTVKPGIEPRASGHIIEQISMIEKILEAGMAYVSDGSVYFDVEKYSHAKHYGILSGRVLDDLMAGTRDLEGQEGKRRNADFALWKKASPEHIMRWPSPWGEGFPGWHIECSAMSTKYLGDLFDIHGGGMDLLFPHHECEIAQCESSLNTRQANFWMHNNMLTINGQKMGKSLGNFITLKEIFSGNHQLLSQAYSPMTIRFFFLQAHYRSTVDFSNEALKAAEKGYFKIINGLRTAKGLVYEKSDTPLNEKLMQEINASIEQCRSGLDDDFNSAVTLAALFQLLKSINSLRTGILKFSEITEDLFNRLKNTFIVFTEDILGLREELSLENPYLHSDLIQVIMMSYAKAKNEKDYATVDGIRASLKKNGIVIKDMKSGFDWAYDE